MRTWYIEDAGGGCRAFSEVLVLVSEEPLEIYSATVPLTWEEKISLEEMACRLVIDMMKKARVSKQDKILVCSGNIFHTLHRWLEEENYNWSTAKMDGLAHEVAEDVFYRQLIKEGVPKEYRLTGRDYSSFYRNIENWVKEQPNSHCYWKDREARRKPAELRYKLKHTLRHKRFCRSCHRVILPYSPVVEHRFRQQGKRYRHFYHPHCSPFIPLVGQLNYATGRFQGQAIEGLIIPFPEKESSPCPHCGQPLVPGQPTFYGYAGKQLVYGHTRCLGV